MNTMPLPELLRDKLVLPVIGAPMLLPCSQPLVIAQCTNGIVGSMPALSARPEAVLDDWIAEIKEALASFKSKNPGAIVAPFMINQIAHKSNSRLERDMETCIRHQVPMIVTSLGANAEIVKSVHSYGGVCFHDVASVRHAEKALAEGVDGLVLLTAGAGGHGGTLNPFAFVTEVRRFYKGPLAVAGGITTGGGVAAVRAMGADLAYMGTRFVASIESRAVQQHKDAILGAKAGDILFTPWFSGVHSSLIKQCIRDFGYDPDDPKLLIKNDKKYSIEQEAGTTADTPKMWSQLWSGGHGVGNIDEVLPVAEIVRRLKAEYDDAMRSMAA
jgi:nitronate monooxygenase